ncbi:MAG: hypothetical protein ACI865_002657 [Flavobacteriaceae bacterium]|jgi:hypothetical protein
MKKIYLSILSGALVFGANSQINKEQNGPVKRSTSPSELRTEVTPEIDNRVTIWSSDFETPADWVLDHDAADCSLDWTIGTAGPAGSFPIAAMATAGNFALVDSDLYGGATGGTEVEDSWITMAASQDLDLFPNVVVEFETFYRRFNSERPYLVVGFGDGSGPASVTWPDLDPLTDISTMTNVFEVFPGWPDTQASDNPMTAQVNITSALAAAVSTANVYIRLNWTGTWGYAWMVDDLAIIEQPENDIQLTAAWFSGVNNYGMEYGNTPDAQLDANWMVGSTIFNFGINDATNVALDVAFTGAGALNYTNGVALLEADSTINLENTEAAALVVGQYDGVYVVVSDSETVVDPTFGNNVGLRSFAVTTDIYSLDGIDVYPASELDLTSLGSNSFTGAEDGLVIAVEYNVKANMQVSGVRVLLATGTVAGGDIYASFKDTSLFRTGDMTASITSDAYTVTAADITQGYADILFNTVETLTPNAYYAAVELYSNGNVNDIRILDDRTVAQPGLASMIYIPGDQSYTNGTASAVRVLVGDQWGASINENTLTGVSLFPNPSNGIVTISNDNNISGDVVVYDMVGKVIATTTLNGVTSLDLTENGVGVYMVKVSSENGSIVERVVIK